MPTKNKPAQPPHSLLCLESIDISDKKDGKNIPHAGENEKLEDGNFGRS